MVNRVHSLPCLGEQAGDNNGRREPGNGSNGDVHRGPDKVFPRANVVRALVLRALTDPGFRVEDLPRTIKELQRMRRHRKGHTLVPMATSEHAIRFIRNVFEEAAMGDREVYGRAAGLLRDMHQIMALPTNGNGKHGSGQGAPFPSSFMPQDPTPSLPPAPVTEKPRGLVVDGREYVDRQ